jgi:hypothetical protein
VRCDHFAVLDAAGKLGKILIGMNRALGEIPLTIKMRTGVREGRNTAHKLMPRITAEWNVAAMTVGHTPLTYACVSDTSPIPPYGPLVARAYKTTAVYEIGRLGLHPRMCQCRSSTRIRPRPYVIFPNSCPYSHSGATTLNPQYHGSLSSVAATLSPRKIIGPRSRAVASTAS